MTAIARPPDPRTVPRWSIGQVGALLTLLAALLALFGGLLGPFDLQVFLQAARHVAAGTTPYGSIHAPAFQTGHAFVYPYLVAWAFVPLALLPAGAAVACYLALSVLAIVAACHLFGKPGLSTAALVLVCSTTIVGLQMGTLNALLFLGIALAWSRRDQPQIAGAAIGLVAVTKLFLLPMIGWLALARRYRAAAAATTVFAFTLTFGSVFGPLGLRGYFRLLGALEGNETQRSWSLSSLLQGLGVGPSAAHVLAIGAAGAVLLAGGICAARRHDERIGFSSAVAASLLLSPIVWSSYLLLLLAPLLVVSVDVIPLAAAAVISWPLVTPDQASNPRVALGIALAALVAFVAIRIHLAAVKKTAIPRARRSGRSPAFWMVVAAGCLLLFLVVPAPARNALPAVLCVGAVLIKVTAAADRGGKPRVS